MRTIPEWISSSDEVTRFARDMVEANYITTIDGLLDYFEKPWHWDREHKWWVAAEWPDTPEAWETADNADFEVPA
jgi:hypothetical protein